LKKWEFAESDIWGGGGEKASQVLYDWPGTTGWVKARTGGAEKKGRLGATCVVKMYTQKNMGTAKKGGGASGGGMCRGVVMVVVGGGLDPQENGKKSLVNEGVYQI